MAGNRRKHIGMNFRSRSANLQAVPSFGPVNVIAEVIAGLRELPRTRRRRPEARDSTGDGEAAIRQAFVWKPLQFGVRDHVRLAALPRARNGETRLVQQSG